MTDITSIVLYTSIAVLLLIATIIITIFMAHKQRIQREVAYEKELRKVENEVQEQVLTNVSHELHDNIGQLLTIINLQLQRQKLNPEFVSTITPIEETVNGAIQQVRLLARSLNNHMLEQNGLVVSIEQEAKRIQSISSITIVFESDEKEPDLNKDQRLMVFRVFQEVLNNALKHAAAKTIRIALNGSSSFLLSITDDGKGFDYDKAMSVKNGMGLKNIVKRASLANLVCTIDSAVGKGSTFTLRESN